MFLFGLGGAHQVARPADPNQQDAECLVALIAEQPRDPLAIAAKQYFQRRVEQIQDAELRELMMISAEEVILTNRNRREIASTCVLLYEVMKAQEDQARRRS